MQTVGPYLGSSLFASNNILFSKYIARIDAVDRQLINKFK